MSRYVGITGFVSRDEVDFALSCLPEGLTLMCGVLVSAKTLRGIPNKWRRRYANPETMADIFSPDPRCLNLIHYSGGGEPPTVDDVAALRALGGPLLHGFQFNGIWPLRETIAPLARGHQVVLQLKTSAVPALLSDPRIFDSIACMFTESRCHLLLDGSGGRGVPLDPAAMRAHVKAIRMQRGYYFGLGVAGGLCAETLPSLSVLRGYEVSIDAEGRLRDGDEGGVLNREKVRAYLRVAGEVMQAPTAPEKG